MRVFRSRGILGVWNPKSTRDGRLRIGHQHDAELRSHGVGLGEDAHDLAGRGAGGNVIVAGLALEKQIADTASDEVGQVATFPETSNDRDGELAHAFMIPSQRAGCSALPRMGFPNPSYTG